MRFFCCSRAWRALMRRNCIYRGRNPIGTFLEIALPVGFVAILLGIKKAAQNGGDGLTSDNVPAFIPGEGSTFRPLSFQDYTTAARAERVCELQSSGDLGISGMADQGNNWMVPMVKCDHRKCKEVGQNATAFCEYSIVAVTGLNAEGLQRASDFRLWMLARYPELETDMPFDFDPIQVFDSSNDISSYVKRSDYGNSGVPKIMAGVVWAGGDDRNYDYHIRMNQTNFNNPSGESRPGAKTTPDTSINVETYSKNDFDTCLQDDGTPDMGYLEGSCTGMYFYNGVITIQRVVGDFILDKTGATAAGYGVSENGVQFIQFPTQPYEEQGFYSEISEYGPIIITLGLLYPAASMIGFLTREKELRQKELMKMMSITEAEIGSSWFTSFFSFHFISIVLCTVLTSSLYEKTEASYLFTYFLLMFWSVINFCSTIATFTSRSTVAILVGLLIFFIGVFLPTAYDYQDGDSGIISLISLHPIAAFGFGMQEIGDLEDKGVGVTSNTWDTSDHPSGYTFQSTINSLVASVIFWYVLGWYSGRVIPQDYGQALSWYFPFTPSYWCPSLSKSDDDVGVDHEIEYDADVPVEPVGENLKRQAAEGKNIEIRKLNKSFGDKTAVDDLSLTMYSGQITALLGHNGAGKTTTISMLTGALAPTSGTAIVAGKNIKTQLSDIREDLGICLQHDCLFPLLTVKEHIQFFSRVKGQYENKTKVEADALVDQAIQDVALMEKRDTPSKNLSGGMKRKLSVAIAFCGGSKIVLLDEPTSGMDPFSRRFTWNVIRQYRQDRCIILTTHFMDEADILGDRIAIMSEGELRCCGSSLFLKKTYGVGYQLVIERNHGNTDGEGKVNLKEIVTTNVAGAVLLSDVGTELCFQLPMGASAQFTPMFEGLDQEIEEGVVSSYGVSITTLDEVFLLVARGGTTGEKKEFESSTKVSGEPSTPAQDADKSARSRMDLDKEGLFNTHVFSLFKKRAAFFRRDKKAWCCTSILPSLFVFFGFLIFRIMEGDDNYGSLTLTLDDFNTKIGSNQGPQNPVVFNEPSGTFSCQPGLCVYGQSVIDVESTNEKYYFCGGQARLPDGSFEQCTVNNSATMIRQIGGDLATPEPVAVSSIRNASLSLDESRNQYLASQYGAVFYTHELDSVLSSNGTLYSDAVEEQCLSSEGNYTSAAVCERFKGVGYTISYNYTALHVSPLFQGLADEALVRTHLGSEEFSATVTLDPMPITKVESGFRAAEDATATWLLMVLSFPFIGGAFASFVVAERESKAKHLQTVAGVKPAAYWISTFLWDTLNYQFPCWITIALMYAFDVKVLTTTNREAAGGVITLLMLYGPAAASFSYCVSFLFKSPGLCSLVVIVFGFLVAMGGPLTIFILYIIGKEDADNPKDNLITAAEVITWVLRFVPAFCLGKGLFNVINIEGYEYLEGKDLSAWSEPILLLEVIFLVWETVVYLLLAIQLDIWSNNPRALSVLDNFVSFVTCTGCFKKKQEVDITTALPDDDDVLAEQDRVLAGEANDDLIVVSQLTKVFGNNKIAVNNMSLGIAPGECFGLLGINGAGKTTTMGMLTAEFPPTSGDATLAGYSVTKEPEKTRRRVGYCPQFDAHFSNLTGREHVELYAAIKGIPKEFINESAASLLARVGLNEDDSDRLAAGYSGGMKRRLSLACAMIGQPQIIFLDECSTGVDPVARREIWALISEMVSGANIPEEERTSVILTTHSMEECEALCPRIGIMANGRLRCLGSSQHLKNKFGQGFQVELKVKLVGRDDLDYKDIAMELLSFKGVEAKPPVADETGEVILDVDGDATALAAGEDIYFTLEEAKAALQSLADNGDYLSSLVSETDPLGYSIWKNASAGKQPLDELAVFCASELRMRKVDLFIKEHYPSSVLRERQDSKSRYEVSSAGVRISHLFASIESNKEKLVLADYGVSQTSLEQVFNRHAAEAEKLKQGRNDR